MASEMTGGVSSYRHSLTVESNQRDDSRQAEFRELVAGSDSRLKHFLLSLTSDPNDADDVLQDTYEIAWRRFSDFRPGTNFYQWIARIAFNQARNFNRKRRKHHGLGLSDDVLADLSRMNSGNSELLEMRQEQLRKCMTQLRAIDQAILLDYYRDDQPKSKLGERYGIRSDVLYKRLFRLRKKLYDCINYNLGLKTRQS